MTRISTALATVGIVVAGILGVVLPAGPAGAQPGQRRIGPDQGFVGLVNDQTVNATIQVLCPGPLRIGERGHPVAGQTIGVSNVLATPTAVSVGFTGSAGHSISAAFTPTPSVAPTITFTTYGDQPIPTTLSLPCYGTATALFVPRPSSPTSRPSRLTVTYEANCGGPICPVAANRRGRD